jgi:nucleoside-diphosphate-sugar epimerase
MRTILVTGATGFLGSYICPILLNKGNKLKIVSRNKSLNNKHINCEIIYTEDLFSEPLIWWLNNLKGVDVVLHLAWYLEHKKYWDSLENIKCLEGSIVLATAALQREIKHFIGIGTCAEYEESTEIKKKIQLLIQKAFMLLRRVQLISC